jgi:hypothetical protein
MYHLANVKHAVLIRKKQQWQQHMQQPQQQQQQQQQQQSSHKPNQISKIHSVISEMVRR